MFTIKKLSKESQIAFIFLISGIIQKGVSVITTPIMTRIMSTSEFGTFSTYNAWYQILYIFITLRIASGAYTQGLIKYSDDRDRFQSSLVGLSLVTSVPFLFVFVLLSDICTDLVDLSFFFILAILIDSLFDGIFQIWVRREIVEKKWKAVFIISVTHAIITPVVGIVCMLHTKYKVEARVWTIVLIDVLLFAPLLFIQLKKGKTFYVKEYWKHALIMSIPLIPHYLSTIVLNQSDRIMIGKICGESDNGIYTIGYSAAFLMQIVSDAINRSLDPWLMQKIKEKNFSSIGKISYILIIGVGIANLSLIMFAPEIIKIFAPEEYYSAIWVIPPVAASVFINFMYNMFADFEFYYEKTYFISAASLCAALLNILLNYIFIPIYGFIAAGYTTLVCYMAFVFAHYFFMRQICKKNIGNLKVYNMKIILLIIMAFFIISTMFEILYDSPFIRYSIITVTMIFAILFREKIMKLAINIKNNMRR